MKPTLQLSLFPARLPGHAAASNDPPDAVPVRLQHGHVHGRIRFARQAALAEAAIPKDLPANGHPVPQQDLSLPAYLLIESSLPG